MSAATISCPAGMAVTIKLSPDHPTHVTIAIADESTPVAKTAIAATADSELGIKEAAVVSPPATTHAVTQSPTAPMIASDQLAPALFPTGQVIVPAAGCPQGDPFIVYQADTKLYIMYYFTVWNGQLATMYKTAKTLSGSAWSASVNVPSLVGYHKFVLLMGDDFSSRPVPFMSGGFYHGFASSGTPGGPGKQITHFSATSITGPWTATGVVLSPANSPSVYDNGNCDTPYAITDGSTIFLYYMCNGVSATANQYGTSSVQMLATTSALSPQGPYVRAFAPCIIPSATPGDFDYGWIGGVQVTQFASAFASNRPLASTSSTPTCACPSRPTGAKRYALVYNAGYNKPSSVGLEPDPGDIGVLFSDSIAGPWAKDPAFCRLTSHSATPTNYPGNVIYWRGHYVYDFDSGADLLFFNASASNGQAAGEVVSVMRGGGSTAYGDLQTIQFLTQAVTSLHLQNTHVYLNAPGAYLLEYTTNVFSSALANMDIRFTIVDEDGNQVPMAGQSIKYTMSTLTDTNGAAYRIPYWNDDQITTGMIIVGSAPRTVHLRADVVSPSTAPLPPPGSNDLQIRQPRFTVTRV